MPSWRNSCLYFGAALSLLSVAWLYLSALRGPRCAIAQLSYSISGPAPATLIGGFSVPTEHSNIVVALRGALVKGASSSSAFNYLTTYESNGRILADDRVKGTFRQQADSFEARMNFSGLRSATVVVSQSAIGSDHSTFVVQASNATGFCGLNGVSVRSNFVAGEDAQEFLLKTRRGLGTSFDVLIRGVGPTLKSFGVQDVVEDPLVEVFCERKGLIGLNDDWDVGARLSPPSSFPLVPLERDAALVCRLEEGSQYRIVVRRKGRSGSSYLIDVTCLR